MKKKLLYFVVLAAGILMLAGCRAGGQKTEGKIYGETDTATVCFTDALNREVRIKNPQRTAVLSASLADAWQLAGGSLYAVTEDAKETVTVTEDMVLLGGVKNPSVEKMIEAGTDFAILSSSIAEHVKLQEVLEQAGIECAYFEVENFADYAAMMKIMTDITGDSSGYRENVEKVQKEIETQLGRKDGSSPSVLFLRAYSTGIKAKGSDSMTGEMLRELGCVNIADSDHGLLDNLSMEAIIDADPDFIFVTTMGESKEEALQMVEEILIRNPAWNGLKAVKDGRYYVLPKELFHNKPNERWGESYRILADYLYEEP